MKVKDGVKLEGVKWQMFWASIVVEGCFAKLGLECVITGGSEEAGRDPKKTLHDDGLALDYRQRTVPVAMRPKLFKAIRQALGPDYDVVNESDHFHVEFDPK